MFGSQRRREILQVLSRDGVVRVVALSRELGCSEATLRRDLQEMDRDGLLRRTHGGALAPTVPGADAEPSLQDKTARCAAQKRGIARAAAKLIAPGDAVALNGGTTTVQVARALRGIANLRLVTNSIGVAAELTERVNVEVTLTGGRLRGTQELHGPLAEQSLRDLYVHTAFIGVDGLTLEHGLTTYNQLEAFVNRAIIARAERVVVVADHTKIGRVTLALIAPCRAVHTLITDPAAPADELALIRAAGIEVILAEPQ